MKIVPLDDYNCNIPKDADVIGAVTTTWGHLALRNGWKLIEVYEENDYYNENKSLSLQYGDRLE